MSVLKIKDSSNQWQTLTTWGDYNILGFTVTLSSSSWSSNAQTVTNSNFVTTGYSYIVAPSSSNFTDYTDAQIYADDVTTASQMTFHCSTAPSSNITVNIIKVKIA